MKRSIAMGILATVAAGAGLISGVMLVSGAKVPKETASRAAAPAATVAAPGVGVAGRHAIFMEHALRETRNALG